jgi:DNA-nicking Smr family endonuclease
VRRSAGDPRAARRTSEQERREFEEDFQLALPIKPKSPVREKKKSVAAGGGLDGSTQTRLNRGLVEPQARLDLHGMTQGAAHRALDSFLRGACERGLRLVVIITGKGNPRTADVAAWTASPHGALKEMVPRWLAEPPLSNLIAKMQAAHIRHGGSGALYVYLRKNR